MADVTAFLDHSPSRWLELRSQAGERVRLIRRSLGARGTGEPGSLGPVRRKQQLLSSNTLLSDRNPDPVLPDDLALKEAGKADFRVNLLLFKVAPAPCPANKIKEKKKRLKVDIFTGHSRISCGLSQNSQKSDKCSSQCKLHQDCPGWGMASLGCCLSLFCKKCCFSTHLKCFWN